jgi:hypothetical protein
MAAMQNPYRSPTLIMSCTGSAGKAISKIPIQSKSLTSQSINGMNLSGNFFEIFKCRPRSHKQGASAIKFEKIYGVQSMVVPSFLSIEIGYTR